MIQGIEHAAIAAKDVERLAAFYVQTLGFEINYRGKTAIFVKASDGSMIEIIPASGEVSEATPRTPGLPVRRTARTAQRNALRPRAAAVAMA